MIVEEIRYLTTDSMEIVLFHKHVQRQRFITMIHGDMSIYVTCLRIYRKGDCHNTCSCLVSKPLTNGFGKGHGRNLSSNMSVDKTGNVSLPRIP